MNEQPQFDLSKSNFITTTYNHQGSTFQTIMQSGSSMPKEVVTVNPIMKMEPSILSNNHIKIESNLDSQAFVHQKSEPILIKKSRGHIDRYNGMTEEEVTQRKLPDYLKENLDLIVVGINPSMTSACVGHHYAGIGNHFWTCITEAGLVPERVTCYDDYRMVDYGIGFTNVCSRPTKGAAEISRKEMKAGAHIMLEKMRKYQPRVAVFNGKGIYEAFIGHKNFYMGKQPKTLEGTDIMVFVMPSSSARCAQLPRAEDKLPFFIALRKIRDYVRGELTFLNDDEVIFSDYTEFRVTQPDPKSLRKAERRRKRKAEQLLGPECTGITLPGRARRNKTIFTDDLQMQKSDSRMSSSNKGSVDMNMSSADLTPVTLSDENVSHVEVPIALYNQATGVITIMPSSDFSGFGGNSFSLGSGSQMVMMQSSNSKPDNLIQNKNITSKPLIIQQDSNGQAYILASPSQFLQTAPQIQSNQTATLVPMNSPGSNATMAILQPSGQLIDTGTATLTWAPQQQQTQYITTQTSNGIVYQKAPLNTNNQQQQPTQQIICTTATLQQLLQQQQQQQQQFQILNQLGYSQQFAIQTPIGLGNGIQLQQVTGCLSEGMAGGDQMSTSGNNRSSNSRDPVSQVSSQNMILVPASPCQSMSAINSCHQPQFAYLSPSSQQIVIPINCDNGGLLQAISNSSHSPSIARSRPMTASSSSGHSGISSVAGQADLDLLSSSSGLMDSGQHYQQCPSAPPLQMADCQDQLVQCSSSSQDQNLIYAAL